MFLANHEIFCEKDIPTGEHGADAQVPICLQWLVPLLLVNVALRCYFPSVAVAGCGPMQLVISK